MEALEQNFTRTQPKLFIYKANSECQKSTGVSLHILNFSQIVPSCMLLSKSKPIGGTVTSIPSPCPVPAEP